VSSVRTVAPGSSSRTRAVPPDVESAAWLRRLRASGHERELAVGELRALLLRAARFEVRRRAAMLAHLRGGDEEDLAQHSADDALMAILAKLDGYRGESRFTTWAYKFALLEAAVKVRRRAWQNREVPLEADHWHLLAAPGGQPHHHAETAELLERIGHAIERQLTPHQREVLVALALDEVPIDVVAQRLSTTRGALYKTLHDARRKLREKLTADGFDLQSRDERSR